MQGYSPPFLGSFKDPAGLMLWSGFVARTAPGWSLLVRPPANLTHSQGYESYEGIIETDRWFGPLFVNLRLTRPNVPIEFDANYPFLQVQPVHRSLYGDALDNFDVVEGIEDLHPPTGPTSTRPLSKPMSDPHRPRGEYAVQTRKRRRGGDARLRPDAARATKIMHHWLLTKRVRSTFSCRRHESLKCFTIDGGTRRRDDHSVPRRNALQPVAPAWRADVADRPMPGIPGQLGWLVFWMSGTLDGVHRRGDFGARAVAQLNAFEMMTVRSSGGLVDPARDGGLASPALLRSVRGESHAAAASPQRRAFRLADLLDDRDRGAAVRDGVRA